MQLIGKNFQSWPEFDLVIDRLTVAVGDSNLGKSALTRALKALLRNEFSAGQVRVGSSLMEVTTLLDGHTVYASRKKGPKGSVNYTVDGEDFSKLDGSVPKPVADLNLGEIKIGDVTLDPIFATQFGEQFLIEEKPGPLTAILGAFSATDKLESGKKVTYGDIAEQNALAKTLAKDMQATEQILALLWPMEVRGTVIAKNLERLEPAIENQERIEETAHLAIMHKSALDRTESMINRLKVPDVGIVARGLSLLTASTAAEAALRCHERTRKTLDRLIIPDLSSIELRMKLVAAYTLARNATFHSNRMASTLAQLQVPDIAFAENRVRRLTTLDGLMRAQKRFDAATHALTATETVVASWTSIVAAHKRGKALDIAIQALEARASSTSLKGVEAIDDTSALMKALINKVEDLAESIRAQDKLASALVSRESLGSRLAGLDEQLKTALRVVEEVTESQRKAELEAAKKAISKAAVCGKCGEKIQAA